MYFSSCELAKKSQASGNVKKKKENEKRKRRRQNGKGKGGEKEGQLINSVFSCTIMETRLNFLIPSLATLDAVKRLPYFVRLVKKKLVIQRGN